MRCSMSTARHPDVHIACRDTRVFSSSFHLEHEHEHELALVHDRKHSNLSLSSRLIAMSLDPS
jgi:hypothetical protein